MKRSSKTWFSLLLTLILLLGCIPSAFAEESTEAAGTEDSGLIDAAALNNWMEE